MKINIIGGRGVMGQIHKPVFEKAGHEVYVTGRESKLTPIEAAKTCDVTIVSVPIDYTGKTIERVAPYAPAIMDFTSLKRFPLEAMARYAGPDAEIGGLHPSYGAVDSIQGRTIFYCRTKRSGKACESVVSALKMGGAEIVEVSPEDHDFLIGGLAQYARMALLETYMKLLQRSHVDFKSFYAACPPPTRVLLDLVARQADEDNDKLIRDMRTYNPYLKPVRRTMTRCLHDVLRKGMSPKDIRRMFGKKELELAQKSAITMINRNLKKKS